MQLDLSDFLFLVIALWLVIQIINNGDRGGGYRVPARI